MPASNPHDISQYSKGSAAVHVVSTVALILSLYMILVIGLVFNSLMFLAVLFEPLIRAILQLAVDHFSWFIIMILVFYIFTTHISLPTPVSDPTQTSFQQESGHKILGDIKAETAEEIRERQEDDLRSRFSLRLYKVLFMEHIAETIDEHARELDSQNQI
ncbi:hypothetical protein M436DRAFT_83532 [Aureobasidium namibiae CBS 147.97]|uniref:Uncharacterized protein n=1 Tax=Aureobasidium namibiae CBS 147.97 TaxID=1043004 RepID=A0A074WNC5_9PEZI